MKKIFLFVLLIFFISLVSADIVSINSYGGDNFSVMSSSSSIEGFLFYSTNISVISVPISGIPGVGGGGGALLEKLNFIICNNTYYHLLKYGNDSQYTLILQKKLKDEYNITVGLDTLRTIYVNSYEGGCSEIINRSIHEDIVCEVIQDFLKEGGGGNVELMIEINENNVSISPHLLEYYVKNYNEACEKRQVLSIVGEGELLNYWWILLILLILLLILADYYLNKKRVSKLVKKLVSGK